MELPFAVESSPSGADDVGMNSSLQHSESSSLVTASSQGSFMSSPLPPNTPQDVVLPAQFNQRQRQQQGQLVVTPATQEPNIDDGYGDPEVLETYVNVNVTETDGDDEVDILLDGADICFPQHHPRGDVLTVLLSGMQQSESDALMSQTEAANEAAQQASEAKKQGDLLSALEYHTQAAKLYKDNAITIRDKNASLANSLLLLSQTQAKSAIALKNIVKLNPAELRRVLPASSSGTIETSDSAAISHKERLRAAVRGALGSRHPHEADLSDSQFLGRAEGEVSSSKSNAGSAYRNVDSRNDQEGTLLTEGQESSHSSSNPVDEMMELERELREMDMALELGNSISSLDSRMQHRMKGSMIDGSFMVVPPGSNSYMASSMWGSGHIPTHNRQVNQTPSNNQGTAGIRARANRVQNILEASATPANRPSHPPHPPLSQPTTHKNAAGLESSWWGNTSTTSQILASSVISLGGRPGMEGSPASNSSVSANTKQIMRLMDSLKALGDENATLLREVEELDSARAEAKAARESMKRFKAEYGKRFASLKKALEKFRQEHPHGSGNNPVNNSDFIKSASVSDQLQRQEQLIRKLTADLKKEKEDSKKKDAALRKYESFYREVKARSAQKAAQRQLENQQQQQQQQRQNVRSRNSAPRPTPR